MPRFWRGGPLQTPLPAPGGVVPKKPKALIQVCFSGQTVEVGLGSAQDVSRHVEIDMIREQDMAMVLASEAK